MRRRLTLANEFAQDLLGDIGSELIISLNTTEGSVSFLSAFESTAESEYDLDATDFEVNLAASAAALREMYRSMKVETVLASGSSIPHPSPAPTHVPSADDVTFAPTEFSCPLTSEGTHDPTKYLQLARPEISVARGSAYALGTVYGDEDEAIFSRDFGLLNSATPGSWTYFSVSMGGQTGLGGTGGSAYTLASEAASVDVLVKTATVYYDSRTVSIAYQLKDAAGRTSTLASGRTISLTLVSAIDSDTYTASFTCGAPSAYTGIGLCTASIDSAWFMEDQDHKLDVVVSVSYASSTAWSSIENLMLVQKPTFDLLSTASMAMSLPHHPLLPGESLSVSVEANTDGQALSLWIFTVSYDANVLEFSSVSTGATYIDAVVVDGSGYVKLATSGLSNGVTDAEVTGDAVDVATLSFVVRSDATAGVHSAAVSLHVSDMVNSGSIKFAEDVTGQVNDERGGAQTEGQITVTELDFIGIFASAPLSEIYNTAPLSGEAVASSISAVAVYNHMSYGNIDVSNIVSCETASSSFELDGCEVTASTEHNEGTPGAAVYVTYNDGTYTGLISTVLFKIWSPVTVTLDADITKLGKVSDCANLYQQASLTAHATFTTGGDGSKSITAIVTDLVVFTSNDDEIVSVQGGIVQGQAAGATTVSLSLPDVNYPSVVGSPISIKVTDEAASIDRLDVVVFNGASWVSSPGAVALNSTVNPEIELSLDLSAEGQEAFVAIYAVYGDGTYEEVGLDGINLTSYATESIAVDSDNSLYVQVGASSVCAPVLHADWLDGCGGVIASGTGVLMLTMPGATSLSASVSAAKLAKSDDPAATAPFSVATSATISATAGYEDGSTQSFSTDSRAVFAIAEDSTDLIELNGNVISVLDGAAIMFDSTASVVISVPSVTDITVVVTVTLAEFASFAIDTTPYPAVSSFTGSFDTLRIIGCSGVYQRLQGLASGALTDGTESSVYAYATWSSSNENVAYFSATTLVPVTTGTVTITATFGGMDQTMEIAITNDEAVITSMAIGSSPGTLTGYVNATDELAIMADFDDGTSLTIASTVAVSSSWLKPSQLFGWNSADSSVIAVNTEGILSLKANHFTSVGITAHDTCGFGITSDTASVFANLVAETYDVDMGVTSGAPFGTAEVGDTIEVEVRIEASSSYSLTAFQVVVTFDDSLVKVASTDDCVQGSGWDHTWECTTNDPVDEVLLVGSCGLSPSSNCNTIGTRAVGVITFTVIGEGHNIFSGYSVKLKDEASTVENAEFFAGKTKH